jgi:O-antigen/teichoic acid export membrane protein
MRIGSDWKILRAELDYARWTLPATWINTLASQTPLWFLQIYHGQSIVGQYALAQRVVSVPVSLVAASIGEVFRQQAANALRTDGDCARLLRRQAWELIALALPACVLLAGWGPELFAWFFGDGWGLAGGLSAAAASVFFCQIVISPLTVMLLLQRRQRLDLGLQVALLGSGAGGFLAGQWGGAPELIIGAWAAGHCLVQIIYLAYSVRLSTAFPPSSRNTSTANT